MDREFDDILKTTYEAGEFEYKAANWEKLKAKLHASKSSKLNGWLTPIGFISFKKMMAAAAVMVIGVSTITLYLVQSTDQQKITANHTQVAPSTTIAPIDSVISNRAPNNLPQVASVTTSTSNPRITTSSSSRIASIQRNSPSLHLQSSITKSLSESNTNIEPLDIHKPIDQDVASNVSSTKIANQTPAFKLMDEKTQLKEYNNSLNVNNATFDLANDKSSIKNGLILAGSFGKGGNNSMYAAGINYQQNISQHFFVEGALAYNSSQVQNVMSIDNSTVQDIKFTSGTNANGGLIPEAISDSYPEYRLKQTSYSHVSFNPAIGYQINHIFSIKAGMDVQRQLNHNQKESYASSESFFKPMPKTDIGFTPKIGVQLSRHWLTNLIYRKGINNLFSKTEYFNRDYFQLQVGYKF